MKEPEETGPCFKCGKIVDTDCFCFGCKQYICSGCEINWNMPFGQHSPKVHFVEPDFEDDEGF